MKKIDLPYNFDPRRYQKPLWNAVMEPEFSRGIVVIPRRNGKDLTCWNLVIAKAMQKPALYFYMAPYYNQVRQIIWEGITKTGRRFLDYLHPAIVKTKTKLDMRIDLINGSQIKLCGSDNIDAIVGTNPYGVVFTEFSLHKRESWDYIRPILAENGGWALFNGTPRGLNHFYQLYKKAETSKKWFVQYLTRDDTNVPTLEAIQEDRDSGMPESLIEQEYYSSWISSTEETLIPLDIIQPAIDRPINQEVVDSFPRIVGADVAYAAKGDKAVIAQRQGPQLLPLKVYQGMDNMSFAAKIASIIQQWHPDAVFIDAGRGEGVISRLIQLNYGHLIIPVHFGGKTYSDLYKMKKDEMWHKTKEWFLNREFPPSIPNDDKLIRDLSIPMFEIKRGFIVVETKAHMKTRGFKSTDRADAVILTQGEEVESSYPMTAGLAKHGITRDMLDRMSGMHDEQQAYDPLSYMDSLMTQQDEFNQMTDPYNYERH